MKLGVFQSRHTHFSIPIRTGTQEQQSFQQLKFQDTDLHQLLHISHPGVLLSLQKTFLRLFLFLIYLN
jgi:hypothetical protein